jgi:shikimate dehydrogenase
MHMAEARTLGLDLIYQRFDSRAGDFDPAQLAALVRRLQAEGYAGVNVTHPFKQAVMPHLDGLSPDARALGAVNTVVFTAQGAIGHNTDWIGWRLGFERTLPKASLKRVVQLGAGGAGSAVAYAALEMGAGLVQIHDLDKARAATLIDTLAARFGADRLVVVEDLEAALAAADGLVNASPVGMLQYPGIPVSPDWLRPPLWVADVVYVPIETELLRQARARGCPVVDGGGMVVFQAAEAFRLFTGLVPDADRMTQGFRRMLLEEA